jgi:3-oxoacyl-ACP reductase-like protein
VTGYVEDRRRLVDLLDLIEGSTGIWQNIAEAIAQAHGQPDHWAGYVAENVTASADYFRKVRADPSTDDAWRKRAAEYLLLLDIDSDDVAALVGSRVTPWNSARTGRRWLDEVAAICWRIYIPLEADDRRGSEDASAKDRDDT